MSTPSTSSTMSTSSTLSTPSILSTPEHHRPRDRGPEAAALLVAEMSSRQGDEDIFQRGRMGPQLRQRDALAAEFLQ